MENQTTSPTPEFVADLKFKGFKVIKIEPNAKGFLEYTRRDFYKIAVVSGKAKVHQANEIHILDGTYLRFSNPTIIYSTEVLSSTFKGYACYFTEDFFKRDFISKNLQFASLFGLNAIPAIKLERKQQKGLTYIFKRMLVEQSGDYLFREDVIRSYIKLLIHESLKLVPGIVSSAQQEPSQRITAQFLELMEQQYPVENPERPLRLKTARDYSTRLSVHVNYLNRMVKKSTGKTTTDLIAERVVSEAKALLKHTDWSITEIAQTLGFEHTNYFNNFFKKRTGTVPKSFRI